ncbi:MAG: hypothetical protein H6660_11330 [Ardenticatenaceae bacterium]|nr:hypothetical protein [Ardenticatenaceae bacterium]
MGRPLPLLLRHNAQLVVGGRPAVAVIEFDFEGQRTVVMGRGCRPLRCSCATLPNWW